MHEVVICDGCNVNPGWEHRCHGKNAFVIGEPTGKPYQCRECRISERLFRGDHKHDWGKSGSCNDVDMAGNEFSGIKVTCTICGEGICLTKDECNSLFMVKNIEEKNC